MGKQSSTSSHKTGNSSRKTPNSSHKQDKQSPKMKGHATLALAQHATSRDVMQAVLQVAHLRALPFRKDLTQDEARVWALSESKRKSDADVDCFLDQLTSNGWLFTKVLLSSAERAPYVVGSACVGALCCVDPRSCPCSSRLFYTSDSSHESNSFSLLCRLIFSLQLYSC